MITRAQTIHIHAENLNKITAHLLTYRCFGDANIAKPKELKGLKHVKEFAFKGKKVKVFHTVGDNIVLHFGTLFSKIASFPDEADMALPTSVLAAKYHFNKGSYKSFVYPDAWCTIYERNEGYIVVQGLLECFRDTFALHVSSISSKLYSCLRECSLQDSRFLSLRLDPLDMESADYYRLCEDLVHWLYIAARNRVKFNKKMSYERKQQNIHISRQENKNAV